jgi:formylglycine-generating enzyme required for sulfatase activity
MPARRRRYDLKEGLMKILKALIYGMAFTLPALFMVYWGPPVDAEREEKASKQDGDEGSETREAVKKDESTARTSWPAAFRTGPQEEITNSVGMKLRLIPAGSFMMGAVPGDDEANSDERSLAQDFHLHGEGPCYPVYYVTWNDTQEFCRKLSEKEGVAYRLPTEAEWEYAARGGEDGKLYVWGDEKTPLVNGVKQANVTDEQCYKKFYKERKDSFDRYGYFKGYDDGYAETSPAGSYAPNKYGLYDMAGNVLEWCADWYDKDYYGVSPAKDPAGLSSSDFRVLRGGCWFSLPWVLRSSCRDLSYPDDINKYVGFRVVRDVE